MTSMFPSDKKPSSGKPVKPVPARIHYRDASGRIVASESEEDYAARCADADKLWREGAGRNEQKKAAKKSAAAEE